MKYLARLTLALGTLLYIWLFTSLAFDQHRGMRTHKADLGQIDQAVWNSSRGRFVEMTDNGFIATRMTDHVEPILAFISPVFWLWDDVQALLLLQVLFVAVGAWFVYELAKKQGPIIALALAIAYLLTPQLQSALLTEFHAAPLAVPLILWAFWAIDNRRLGQTISAILLTASVKEEMALLAAGLGVWAILQFTIYDLHNSAFIRVHPRPKNLTLLTGVTILSLAWFIIATFVIVPAHAVEVYGTAESSYFQRYGALGNSPTDIFTSFFTQPQTVWAIATEPVRLNYLWNLAAPFGLLCLLAPEILLLSLPLLLANLLSAYPAQYYGEFHYSAPLVPYFVVSAVYGMRRLETEFFKKTRFLRKSFIGILSIWIIGWAVFTYTEIGRGPGAARYDPTPINNHHKLLQTLVDQLPPDAAVTATAAVHPHVSHRRYVYQFPIGIDPPSQANWALLDVTTATDMAPGDVKQQIDMMLAGDWGVVDGVDGFLLLQKGESHKEIPDAFYDFARVLYTTSDTEDKQPLDLIHTEVEDWPRWRQTKVITQWHVGKDFTQQPTLPNLEIRTPSGQTLYTLSEMLSPTLLWYPPEQWQAGETIRIASLPLYLPQTWGLVAEEPDGWKLIHTYNRGADDQLASSNPFNNSENISTARIFRFTSQEGAEQAISVETIIPNAIWPGGLLDVHLRWAGVNTWPSHLSAFVHLRQRNENRSQSDGAPRSFVSNTTLPENGRLHDWRQLPIPIVSPAVVGETWQVVIGLYEPQSGQRADLLGDDGQPMGNELVVGNVKIVSRPLADQACALIPATCP